MEVLGIVVAVLVVGGFVLWAYKGGGTERDVSDSTPVGSGDGDDSIERTPR